MTDYTAYYKSPVGIMEIKGTEQYIISVSFPEAEPDLELLARNTNMPAAVRDCTFQLDEYFKGIRATFNLPLQSEGTDFQKSIWKLVNTIPYGTTTTYKSIAGLSGDDKRVRAAGTAVGRNRLAIIIPCHRVVGSDNALRGYAWGVWRKEWLLAHEKRMLQHKEEVV